MLLVIRIQVKTPANYPSTYNYSAEASLKHCMSPWKNTHAACYGVIVVLCPRVELGKRKGVGNGINYYYSCGYSKLQQDSTHVAGMYYAWPSDLDVGRPRLVANAAAQG